MNLHEYQAKALFAEYGLPVSTGYPVDSAAAAIDAMKKLGGSKWVVKAQVHAGGRGKAGGVKLVSSEAEVEAFVNNMLGSRLVTYQTDANGQPVNTILVESCTDIADELYLGAVIDRSSQRVVFMASTEGGVEIEKVAHETPELIHKVAIDPLTGPMPYQGRDLGFKLGLEPKQVGQFAKIFMGLAQMFIERDVSLMEINPLVVTSEGDLHCLDAKVVIDDSALYRQKALAEMRDASQEDEREERAAQWDLNYISLDGDIGCMVNGAGLAMATMDLIKLEGGEPANFLDVGGGANKERVAEAFKIILSDTHVRGVLVNIFGGIVQCDMIAEGIIAAVAEVGVNVPVVVRLEGTNSELGAQKLRESDLNIIAATGFTDGAKKIVEAVKVAA